MSKFGQKIMIIVNPSSGCGKALDMLPEVDRMLKAFGHEPDIRLSESPSHATETARIAAQCGYDRVIALGGDGTINMVSTGIAGSESILGVIPAGKGNDFFSMLDIDNKFETICRAAVSGDPQAFDVGIFNENMFFNMLGIGFDAKVAMEVKKTHYNLGLASYLLAVYKTLKNYTSYNIRLRIDSLEIERTILLVAVGLGRSTGGGFHLTPQAEVNDGKFDVCVATQASRRRIISLLPLALKGKHIREPEVTMYRCRQLEIFSETPLPVHYEGETFTTQNGKISVKMSLDKLKVATGIKTTV
jgi:diacylglycerol kinase (ATP)